MKTGKFRAYVWVPDDEEGDEVDIEVTWEGHYQKAKISGPPEDCYPAEGEVDIIKVERLSSLPSYCTEADFTKCVEQDKDRLEDLAWDELMIKEEDTDCDYRD